MRMALILFLFGIVLNGNAAEKRPERPEYTIISDTLDPSLKEGKSKITFQVNEYYKEVSDVIRYSIDDESEAKWKLDKSVKLTRKLHSGDHLFMFLLSVNYQEIIIKNLKLESQHHVTVVLSFRKAKQNNLVRKPVIYLYPEKDTNVSLQLHPKGELTFTYPEYNEGWNIKAHPDGSIEHEGASYNYLFWESEQEDVASLITQNEGFIVAANDLVPFLEKTLTQFGLTSEEQTDFITYWVPSMNPKTNLYIYFLFNEECDAFASLKISPEPTTIARLYMLWTPVTANYDVTGIIPQEIPTVNREGFTVIEWGGAEVELPVTGINDTKL